MLVGGVRGGREEVGAKWACLALVLVLWRRGPNHRLLEQPNATLSSGITISIRNSSLCVDLSNLDTGGNRACGWGRAGLLDPPPHPPTHPPTQPALCPFYVPTVPQYTPAAVEWHWLPLLRLSNAAFPPASLYMHTFTLKPTPPHFPHPKSDIHTYTHSTLLTPTPFPPLRTPHTLPTHYSGGTGCRHRGFHGGGGGGKP
jgi:hypothetical protein